MLAMRVTGEVSRFTAEMARPLAKRAPRAQTLSEGQWAINRPPSKVVIRPSPNTKVRAGMGDEAAAAGSARGVSPG